MTTCCTPRYRFGIVAGFAPCAARKLGDDLRSAAKDANAEVSIEFFWEPVSYLEDPLALQREEAMMSLDAACQGVKHKLDALFIVSGIVGNYAEDVQTEVVLPVIGVNPSDDLVAVAKKAIECPPARHPLGFKIGMIGGLGPAATVDLFDKIVKATPATNDQEHIKLAIEENPQVPDRTACLLHDGKDPTVAMYHAAKRLEGDGCDVIIVPCNTAHAFLPTIAPRLRIPFVDMQMATLEDIKARFPEPRIGLLATSGTIATGIYGNKARALGLPLSVPDEEHQKLVMSAIYGPKGAKAGFCDGVCKDELLAAAQYLVEEHNCNVLILGCTELPLILDECDAYPLAGKTVAFADPTAILARKVAGMAIAANTERKTR